MLDIKDFHYTFALPVKIAPKYNLTGQTKVGKATTEDFELDIDISINTNNALYLDTNPRCSKNDLITIGRKTNGSVIDKRKALEGDFVITITTHSDAIYPTSYHYYDKELDENYYLIVHRLNSQIQTNIEKEYIFFLDRSGSMEGEKISDAINALEFAIKSLPENCTFNIVSFGSEYSCLWNESRTYTDANINEALVDIRGYTANMNGTELLKPIDHYFGIKPTRQRNFFIITDAEVDSSEYIYEKIRSKHKLDRYFTIGVGNSVDRQLLETISSIGHGKCEILIDSAKMNECIVGLIEVSTQDYYSNVSIESDEKDCPCSISSTNILPGIPFVALVQSRGAAKVLTLKAKNSQDQDVNAICPVCASEATCILRYLYASSMMKDIVSKQGFFKDKIANSFATEFSLKYNIVSPYTSFLVVDDTVLDYPKHVGPANELQVMLAHLSFIEPFTEQGCCLERLSAQAEIIKGDFDTGGVTRCSAVQESFFSRLIPKKKVLSSKPGAAIGVSESIKNSFMNFIGLTSSNKQESKLDPKDILSYQKADGSFKMEDELMKLIGLSKQDIDAIKSMPKGYFILQEQVLKYLKEKKDLSFRLIIQKLEKFIAKH